MKYVSGKFELDKRARRLLYDGIPVVVSQRGIDILIYLIERQGAPASKKELLAAVWPDESAVESRLVKQISLLRQSLESVAEGSSVIVTVSGFGYCVDPWEACELKATPVPVVEPEPPAFPQIALVTDPELTAAAISVRDAAAPTGWRRLPRSRRIVISGLLFIFVSYIFLLIISQIEGRFQLGPSRILLAKNSSSFKHNLNFSRNGRLLAYYQADEPDDDGELVILNLDDDRVSRLPDELQPSEDMAWAPDNQSILLVRAAGSSAPRRDLVVASIDGRGRRTVGQVEAGGVDWAPDGQRFAICDRPEGGSGGTLIYLLAIDGQSRRPLTTNPLNEPWRDRRPRFSPDGSQVAFIRRVEWEGLDSEELFVVDVGQGRERQLTFDNARITDVDWSPNGQELLYISDRSGVAKLWRLSIAAGTAGAPGLVTSISNQLRSFSLSNQGELAYVCLPGNTTQIDLVPLPVSPLTSLIERKRGRERLPCTLSSISSTHSPVFSPAGSQIAFISDRSGTEEIWVANTDCSGYRQLTFLNATGLGSPDWSPDGARIAFNRNVGGQSDIFAVELASSRVERLTASPGVKSLPRWSRTPGEIYYRLCPRASGAEAAQTCRLLKLDLRRNETVPVIEDFDGAYALDFDRAKLYFTRRARLWRQDLKSGSETLFAATSDIPARDNWHLRDNRLFLIDRQRRMRPMLVGFDLVSGRREQVMSLEAFLPGSVPGVTVSPDGRLLAHSSLAHGDLEIRLASSFR